MTISTIKIRFPELIYIDDFLLGLDDLAAATGIIIQTSSDDNLLSIAILAVPTEKEVFEFADSLFVKLSKFNRFRNISATSNELNSRRLLWGNWTKIA